VLLLHREILQKLFQIAWKNIFSNHCVALFGVNPKIGLFSTKKVFVTTVFLFALWIRQQTIYIRFRRPLDQCALTRTATPKKRSSSKFFWNEKKNREQVLILDSKRKHFFVRSAFPQTEPIRRRYCRHFRFEFGAKILLRSLRRIGPRTFCFDDSDKSFVKFGLFFSLLLFSGGVSLLSLGVNPIKYFTTLLVWTCEHKLEMQAWLETYLYLLG